MAHAPAVLPRPGRRASRSCRGCGCTRSRTTGAWSRCRRRARPCASPSTSCRRSSSRSRRTPRERTWDRHLVARPGRGRRRSAPPTPSGSCREGFHAHAPTMIAAVSALRRAGARCGRAAAGVHDRRPARSAGVAEAGLGRPRPARDRRRGRGGWWGRAAASTSTTRRALRALELDVLRRVVPGLSGGGGAGQVELSTSPYFHPILPLLCDSAAHHAAHPRRAAAGPAVSPAGRRGAAADAGHRGARRWFGERARRASGRRRAACRTPAAAEIARAGFRWMASDEEILVRPLDVGQSRSTPRGAFRPHALSTAAGEVRVLFRDHALSDLVGFTYQGWSAEAAADDFVDAGARCRPTCAVHGRGQTGGAGDPRRRERLGALRRRRPPVPAGALPAARRRAGHRDRRHAGGGRGPGPAAVVDLRGLVDQRRLRDLDWPPRRPPGLGQLLGQARAPRCGAGRGAGGGPRARRSKRSSPPRAATGAGGTATTIRRRTTGSSTPCSAATCRGSTPRSAKPVPEALHRVDHHDQHRAGRPGPAGSGRAGARRRRTSPVPGASASSGPLAPCTGHPPGPLADARVGLTADGLSVCRGPDGLPPVTS